MKSQETSAEAELVDNENVSVLDEEPQSIIYALLSQLRAGMDLHKVTFPSFVLEPRSLLERITDFMAHQDLILKFNSYVI